MSNIQGIAERTITIPSHPNSENRDLPGWDSSDEMSDEEGCYPGKFCHGVFVFVLTALVFIIGFPICLLYTLGRYLACGIKVTEESTPQEGGGGTGIYQKVQEFQETTVRLAKLESVILSRVLFCVLVWIVVNISVPSLRRKTVFGSQLWKWTLLAVFVTCGYSVISITSRVFLDSVTKRYNGENDFVYYLAGLRRNISFTIYSVSVLSTWLLYFRSSHGLSGTKTHISNDVFDVMTWTLVSLLICALLWLLKTVLLLKWQAHAVYKRFRDRILRAGFPLFFGALISGTSGDKAEAKMTDFELMRAAFSKNNMKKEKEKEKRIAKHIRHIGDRMLSKNVTTYDIKQMARCFIALAKLSSREDDDISDLLATCRNDIPRNAQGMITRDNLRRKLGFNKNEVELLFAELQGKHTSAEVSYETFEKWMVRAHKHCLALGYTLIDAKKVVDCLNKLMIGFLIAATILSWLLLTKIATTKLLVIIASPILAATFIFGDTCKTLFEGIIFAFVKHPFDVGDLCIIDNIEMEVKYMGILATSFLKMGTKDQVWYQNSILATKAIVNLKGDPDPTDFVELSLDPTTETSKITDLEGKINEYISSNDHGGKFENSNHIVFKEIGNSIRIAIHFKHKMSTLDMTHSQFVDKKNRQRSEFLFKVKQFLEVLQIKTSTAS